MTWTASDGYPLVERRWHSHSSCRGVVLALHGIQSHGGWYVRSARALAASGFDVVWLDRRGSGWNSRDRGHAISATRLVNDVLQWSRSEQHRRRQAGQGGLPIVLLAVSWGAKLATAAALAEPALFAGLALLAPGLFPRIRPTRWQQQLLQLAVWLGDLHRLVPVPLDDPRLFTADPAWQQFIANDPLAVHRVTTGFLAATAELDRLVAKRLTQLNIPHLVMLAGDDQIVDNAATRAAFSTIGDRSQQTWIEYPPATHTLEFDAVWPLAESALIDWLYPVCAAAAANQRARLGGAAATTQA